MGFSSCHSQSQISSISASVISYTLFILYQDVISFSNATPHHDVDLFKQQSFLILGEVFGASRIPPFERLLLFNLILDFFELQRPSQLADFSFQLQLADPDVVMLCGDSQNRNSLVHSGGFFIEFFDVQHPLHILQKCLE